MYHSSVYLHMAVIILTAMFDSMSGCQDVSAGRWDVRRVSTVDGSCDTVSPEKFNIFNLRNDAMEATSSD